MKTLITGTTGFIGSHLLEEMLKTKDKSDIYCLVRKDGDYKRFKDRGLNVVKSGLEDNAGLTLALKDLDIEIVYHLAASARINRPQKEYLENNIIGTENIMRILCDYRRNLKKVVYMSSIHAYPNHRSSYAESKRGCEEIVVRKCKEMEVPYCILRPPIVYGPGSKVDAGLMRFISAVKNKKLLSRLNFPGVCSLVYIYDLVRFCLLVGQDGKANNRIFDVYSDKRIAVKEIMEKIAMNLGVPLCRIKLPPIFYDVPRFMLPLLSGCFGYGATLAASLGLLLNDSWAYNTPESEDMLGFEPHYNFDKGLEETLRWLDKEMVKF